MLAFVAQRIAQLVVVLLAISTFLFFALRLSGDPIALLVPPEATPATIEAIRVKFGLDQPLLVQYWTFLKGLTRLDFGTSIIHRVPAITVALTALPNTIMLALAAIVLTIVVALPAGTYAAIARNSIPTRLILFGTALGQAMPAFWMGILLILVFSVTLGLLPSFGHGTWRHMILPAITVSSYMVVRRIRLVRSEMLETLHRDYIRTATAKGLPRHVILAKHAFKNCLLPVITVIRLDLGHLIGGAVITETIFAWPGIGRELVQAVLQRDYPVVQAIVFITASAVVLINLFIEISYAFIDKRISYGAARA